MFLVEDEAIDASHADLHLLKDLFFRFILLLQIDGAVTHSLCASVNTEPDLHLHFFI